MLPGGVQALAQRNASLVDKTLRTSGVLQQQAAEFRALGLPSP
ncbi:MAG TPA: hypothetical protein VK104_09320 [Burkholderiaceae bacterium]|nr:hypothetical protein [Burkholderiaceae bacterium]